MLKICIVNPFEHGGGAEYQISLLIDALRAAERYEIHYLTHFIDVRDRTRSYRVTVIGSGGPIPRLGYLMEAPSLIRALRHLKPSVIYQRVACGYTGVCAYYSRRRGIPLIWHVAHDTDVASKLLEPVRNVPRQRLEKWAVAYGARHATGIVVQTQHQADLLQANFARGAAAVIPNFHPDAADMIDKSGPLTVLWVSNLKPWKRPEVFVRLAGRFRERSDVRFIMVGAVPDAGGNPWWQDLRRIIESTPNLEFLGSRSHSEVNALLARAHIFVNTSTHEGFPNTFIQAWQREAAVVSLSVDPDGVLMRERVGVAAQTEPSLETTVRALIDDRASLAGYVVRGRAHVRLRHSLSNARRLVALIDSYAQGSRV